MPFCNPCTFLICHPVQPCTSLICHSVHPCTSFICHPVHPCPSLIYNTVHPGTLSCTCVCPYVVHVVFLYNFHTPLHMLTAAVIKYLLILNSFPKSPLYFTHMVNISTQWKRYMKRNGGLEWTCLASFIGHTRAVCQVSSVYLLLLLLYIQYYVSCQRLQCVGLCLLFSCSSHQSKVITPSVQYTYIITQLTEYSAVLCGMYTHHWVFPHCDRHCAPFSCLSC